jgi:hypothetical protein
MCDKIFCGLAIAFFLIFLSSFITGNSYAVNNSDGNTSLVAKGRSECLEISLVLEKNYFTTGEHVNTKLTLKNISGKIISIEYFPNMPFNILLYDRNGELIETLRGPRAASMVRPFTLELGIGDNIFKEFSFNINHPSGEYELAGVFVGIVTIKSQDISSNNIVQQHCKMTGKTLMTELIPITITYNKGGTLKGS